MVESPTHLRRQIVLGCGTSGSDMRIYSVPRLLGLCTWRVVDVGTSTNNCNEQSHLALLRRTLQPTGCNPTCWKAQRTLVAVRGFVRWELIWLSTENETAKRKKVKRQRSSSCLPSSPFTHTQTHKRKDEDDVLDHTGPYHRSVRASLHF